MDNKHRVSTNDNEAEKIVENLRILDKKEFNIKNTEFLKEY